MKIQAAWILLACGSAAGAADLPMGSQIADDLRVRFHFEPQDLKISTSMIPATDDPRIVTMAPFTVTDARQDIKLSAEIDRQQREMQSRDADALINGGTLVRRAGPEFTTELRFKFDPEVKGVEFFRLSW